MNVNSLELSLKYLSGSGYTLGTEKSVLLQNSMTILQNENHFHKIFLWGQLLGLQSDYYIAFGYEKDALYGRIFYYR
jgi:radial spoke head protein 9